MLSGIIVIQVIMIVFCFYIGWLAACHSVRRVFHESVSIMDHQITPHLNPNRSPADRARRVWKRFTTK